MISYNDLIKRIANAQEVVVLTGAGVSAESGIKTFRDPDGLWTKFNPAELASIEGFMANPDLVWSWYRHRVEIIQHSKPNPGHYAISELERIYSQFTLITQNVDRLHQQAGSVNVLELHGNIIENHCFDCKKPYVTIDTKLEKLPECDDCGGKIRPSVVWFGESLPYEVLLKSEIVAKSCDVFFSVGTSSELYPAASLPHLAKQYGALVIEVNPNETGFTPYADYKISEYSGVALPELVSKIKIYREKEMK